MAWRLTGPDAPGLSALVTDEGRIAIPTTPDTEDLIIGTFDDVINDPVRIPANVTSDSGERDRCA